MNLFKNRATPATMLFLYHYLYKRQSPQSPLPPLTITRVYLILLGGEEGMEKIVEEKRQRRKKVSSYHPSGSLFDCSYTKTGTVNDGKDGWECVWCGKRLAPRHAPRALKHVLKIKITNIAICRATIPDRFCARYLSLFNADQVRWKQRSVQMNIVKSPWCH